MYWLFYHEGFRILYKVYCILSQRIQDTVVCYINYHQGLRILKCTAVFIIKDSGFCSVLHFFLSRWVLDTAFLYHVGFRILKSAAFFIMKDSGYCSVQYCIIGHVRFRILQCTVCFNMLDSGYYTLHYITIQYCIHYFLYGHWRSILKASSNGL